MARVGSTYMQERRFFVENEKKRKRKKKRKKRSVWLIVGNLAWYEIDSQRGSGVTLRIGRMLPSWRWKQNGILVVTKPRRCRDHAFGVKEFEAFSFPFFFFFHVRDLRFWGRVEEEEAGRNSRIPSKSAKRAEKERSTGKQSVAPPPFFLLYPLAHS